MFCFRKWSKSAFTWWRRSSEKGKICLLILKQYKKVAEQRVSLKVTQKKKLNHGKTDQLPKP